MTVIVWTPDEMATDSLATRGDTRFYVQKLFREGNTVFALAGPCDYAASLAAWFRGGRKLSDWPSHQEKDDYAQLVFTVSGKLYSIDRTPYPIEFNQPFAAFGCGREFALGALAAGATARQAVEITRTWCEGVGGSVQLEKLR